MAAALQNGFDTSIVLHGGRIVVQHHNPVADLTTMPQTSQIENWPDAKAVWVQQSRIYRLASTAACCGNPGFLQAESESIFAAASEYALQLLQRSIHCLPFATKHLNFMYCSLICIPDDMEMQQVVSRSLTNIIDQVMTIPFRPSGKVG